jgi:RNA polymerase sigma factor (sigma-70 family)
MSIDVASRLTGSYRDFLAFVERRVGDRAIAADILQEAFVKSLERGDDVRDGEAAVAWFYRLLRNAVIDHYRRSDTRTRALEGFAKEMEDAVVPAPEVERVICSCIAQLAETLKPEYATAIRRVELEEVPVQSFAAESGITANNAAVRVFRAREALRKQVKAACRTCAEHGCEDCTCGTRSAQG